MFVTRKEPAMYLGWHDSNRKKPTHVKIAEATERYEEKTGRRATLVLLNPKDAVQIDGLTVRTADYVALNTFLIGELDPLLDVA